MNMIPFLIADSEVPTSTPVRRLYFLPLDNPAFNFSGYYWHASEVQIEENIDIKMFERPTSFIISNEHVYLGLNTGTIKKINLKTKETISVDRFAVDEKYRLWDLFGSKQIREEHYSNIDELEKAVKKTDNHGLKRLLEKTNNRFSDLHPTFFSLHLAVQGFRSIDAMALYQGRVYDGSSAGLYETDSGALVKGEWVTSFVAFDTKLGYVPIKQNFQNILETGSKYLFAANAGDLIDLMTGDTLIYKLTPFDGSGFRQADYCFGKESVFVHHGNWPHERITERDIQSGEIKSSIRIPTTRKLFSHNGEVFDVRDYHNQQYLTPSSEEDFEKKSLCRLGSLDSVVSGRDLGILISNYDSKRNQSKVYSIENPMQSLFEVKGRISFL
ncbi:MAG: hypothetical protein KJ685_03225 [Nanoarchaeota archaeon]|nr:hypothetical protein [Nanoarchaeota archaeon]